ncbi:MAG TPA: nuclear transport factor 2 family protein [Desulfosporosinus sp.]|nr:nuclear transport factor 2 family protein [Desulfosporosinus sp.]
MSLQLPQVIETYFQASNSYDSSLLASCFAENAVLYDEGLTYRGPAAIEEHIVETNNKLSVKTEVTNAVEKNGETIITATLSGNFEGSPIPLDFHFTLENQTITMLNIVLAGE